MSDRQQDSRRVTLSKLDKFQKLARLPNQSDADLVAHFVGVINNDNDRSDARLLAAFHMRVRLTISFPRTVSYISGLRGLDWATALEPLMMRCNG